MANATLRTDGLAVCVLAKILVRLTDRPTTAALAAWTFPFRHGRMVRVEVLCSLCLFSAAAAAAARRFITLDSTDRWGRERPAEDSIGYPLHRVPVATGAATADRRASTVPTGRSWADDANATWHQPPLPPRADTALELERLHAAKPVLDAPAPRDPSDLRVSRMACGGRGSPSLLGPPGGR